MWRPNSAAIVLGTRLAGRCDLIVADAAVGLTFNAQRQITQSTASALRIVISRAKGAALHACLCETVCYC